MEVHAHTRPPPDSHRDKRKKWAHYFWEFLMLFLAVFCGFLAENQREHMIENKRARVYARNLLKDLQSDTADIRKAERYESRTSSMIDSLVDFIDSPGNSQKGGQLYYYSRLAGSFYTIDWNRATLNQLINSGNLRYFNNFSLINKISAYNTLTSMIISIEETIESHRSRSSAFKDRIFIARHVLNFMQLSMDDVIAGKLNPSIDSMRNTNPPLQNKDPELLNGFANALISTKPNRTFLNSCYRKAIQEATEIMDLLKKEYHLK